MEREQIAKIAHKMETKSDLLKLLNSMLYEDMEHVGKKFFPFTMKQINFYCNPNHTSRRYKHFNIKKKSGSLRHIAAPRTKAYKQILRYINEILQSMYSPSKYAMGFTQGLSILSNSQKHVKKNFVLNIDLKDFFPSIEQPRVWKRLQLMPFNFPIPLASVIAGLCCMKETIDGPDGNKIFRYVLPQGAPTSPIITNIICDRLDRRLGGLAKRFGLDYTRYADDITFSSMHNVYQEDGEFWAELRRIIKDQGFTINEAKTRLQKRGYRQEVTGIIVNEKPNVNRRFVREIRSILYIWEKYGYNVAMSKFIPKYKIERPSKKGNPDLANVIDGKLMYLKMIKGEDDSCYSSLRLKFTQLVDADVTNNNGLTNVFTLPILDFEEQYDTLVKIEKKEAYEETITAPKAPNNTFVKKHKARWSAHFIFNGVNTFASVNKGLNLDISKDKSKLAISYCRDIKGKVFWFIQAANTPTLKGSTFVDVDNLNTLLDKLLNST